MTFIFCLHLSHHQLAKQWSETGKSAPWMSTGRAWTRGTKQFGGGLAETSPTSQVV